MLSGEATHTNFIVFGLTRLGLEPTIYRTGGEHANHYTTDALEEEFEDKKMVIRIHRSKKDGHHNTVHIITG
jgi:hypothetical protein